MKIAYILAQFPSISETFIQREITALKNEGFAVTIFALRRPDGEITHPGSAELVGSTEYRPALFSAAMFMSNIYWWWAAPVECLAMLGRVMAGNWRRPIVMLKTLLNFPAALYFARIAKKHDARHVHAHFAFIPADIAMIVAEMLEVNYSISAHAWDIYTQNAAALSGKIKNSAFVATCTEHGRSRLVDMLPHIPEGRIVTVRHGLDMSKFRPDDPEHCTILAVGRLVEKKGFRYLVEACQILKQERRRFKCLIAGDGPMKELLNDMIAGYDLDDFVSLEGAMSEEQLAELYERATVLVVPSIVTANGDMDGLPNVILEALAMKVPVVASAISAIPELIINGETGFLAPQGSQKAMAKRIAMLLDDPDLRRRIGENGRTKVESDYDISMNVKELIKLFKLYGKGWNYKHDQ